MSKFHITVEMMRAAYEYLRSTWPYCRWRLPHADEVEFKVLITEHDHGHFRGGKYGSVSEIAISIGTTGTTHSLIEHMAHEMVHLRQHQYGSETPGTKHNADFRQWAVKVAKYHGFDPKGF